MTSRSQRVTLALLASVGVAAYLRSQAQAKKRAGSSSNASDADAPAPAPASEASSKAVAKAEAGGAAEASAKKKSSDKGKKKGDPMARIAWLLFPFFKSSAELAKDGELARVGAFELVSIFIVSCLRTWHSDRMVYIKRDLMAATYMRNTELFKRVLLQTVGLSMFSSIIFALHRFLKERLALVWRMKLTRQLHKRFFHDHAYYKISHLNENRIPDVEERITRDPRRFCKSLADEMEKLSAAATSGVWFTYKLTQITSLPYAVSPLIYFFIAFQASMTIAPNWSKRWREMLDMKGVYEKLHTRVQTHAEAIAAYQGATQERKLVDEQWSSFIKYCFKFVEDAAVFTFVASGFFEYGAHTFAEALIVGRFMSPDAPGKAAILAAKTPKERVKASAALFGELRYLTEYFIRAMAAQGTVIAVLRQLQNMRGPAKRLTELFDVLDEFERRREANTSFKDDPERIAFENVDVYTPTGHLLVKDLNFGISRGTSMLLTGCNGSGKSSLFRCLGALWPIKEGGVITKPGGNHAGLNESVFYLPQRPYSVLGTLRDQLSYPAPSEVAKNISRETLKELLDEVDLGYLIDRKDGDDDINWEDVLSLGEKQRLAAARLFFHSPKFAILDECTSGVSAAMEKRLYETCERRGITCITISHRPVLEQYHDVVLNILADGKGGWSWRETNRGKAASSAEAVKSETGEQALGGYSAAYNATEEKTGAIAERVALKARSKKYEEEHKLAMAQKAKEMVGSKKSTRDRLVDVMKRFAPKGLADFSDPENRRIALLGFMIVAKTVLADIVARFDGYIVSTVLTSEWSTFFKAISVGAVLRTLLALFDAQILKHKWFLNLAWRQRLTTHLGDLYFNDNVFYDIKNRDDRIRDPDERIAEQVEQLSIALTDLWTALLKPAFDITFSTIMLYRALGLKGVVLTTSYLAGGAALMRYVIPNFRELRRAEFDLEGRFRFVHTRLSTHTESVAFFGGDEVEHTIAEKRLAALEKHIAAGHEQSLKFNFFSNFSIKQTPDIISFSLRMMYALTKVEDADVLAGGGGDVANNGEYIQQTVARTFQSFGEAFDLQETLGQFVGVLENVTDFMYVLEDLRERRRAEDSKKLLPSGPAGEISFTNVDIVAPGALCIAQDLSFEVLPGKSLVVTGPNASGKSSLFRTLGGLWPIPTGQIRRPCDEKTGKLTPKQVFLVPQKPYSVVGSLADQITYPERLETRTEAQEKTLMSLLELVRVPYLVAREGGWDSKAKWEDTLSLGEQQRIGMARMYYHQPRYAILDECTSAVSIDVERELYSASHDRGITSITISQRLALEEFHDHELRFGDEQGEKGWSYRGIPKA